jgi:hypothetical protein
VTRCQRIRLRAKRREEENARALVGSTNRSGLCSVERASQSSLCGCASAHGCECSFFERLWTADVGRTRLWPRLNGARKSFGDDAVWLDGNHWAPDERGGRNLVKEGVRTWCETQSEYGIGFDSRPPRSWRSKHDRRRFETRRGLFLTEKASGRFWPGWSSCEDMREHVPAS